MGKRSIAEVISVSDQHYDRPYEMFRPGPRVSWRVSPTNSLLDRVTYSSETEAARPIIKTITNRNFDYFYLYSDIFRSPDSAEPPMPTKQKIAGVPVGVPIE